MLVTAALAAAVLLALGAWLFLTRTRDHWRRRGLPHRAPELLFGNVRALALRRLSCTEGFRDLYASFPGHPLAGIFLLWRPVLLVRDPSLIGRILVDDFDSFRDRGYGAQDQLLQDLFLLHGGEKWKTLRSSLDPGFGEEGARCVFNLVDEMAQRLVKALRPAADRGAEVDILNQINRFVIDAVGTCAFGVEFDSMTNINAFVIQKTSQVQSSTFLNDLRKTLVMAVPDTARAMGIGLLRPGDGEAFRWMAGEIVRHRSLHKVRRNDLIQLLQQLVEKSNGFGREIFESQVFMMLLLGREKIMSVLTLCIHELAMNPVVQSRARVQVDTVLRRHDGQLTPAALSEMAYLDMVLSETLRLYPPLPNLSRHCTATYRFPGTTTIGDGSLQIEPGETPLYIPICGMHRDRQHFPIPERFDPDRFSPEQTAKRPPFTFLPFGAGPRSCLGQRLALLLMKMALVRLLSCYEFFPSDRTKYPAPIDPRQLVLYPKDELWVKISHRHWLPCD